MTVLIQCLAAMFASAAFGWLLRQPKRTMVFTSLIGVNGYVIFLLMGQTAMAYFVASLAVGQLCELTARVTRMATTLFLVSAIIPLVPGLGLYRTIMYIAQDNFAMALSMGVETVTGIGAIALSLTIATTVFSNIRLHVKPDSPPT